MDYAKIVNLLERALLEGNWALREDKICEALAIADKASCQVLREKK